MKKVRFLALMILCFCVIGSTHIGYAQSKTAEKTQAENCRYWTANVVPTDPLELLVPKSVENDSDVMEAIECLLQLEGNKEPARFSGATHPRVSQMFKEWAKVEVAALYYISYLYYHDWKHANAVALVNEVSQSLNSQKSITRAYELYREWFKKVKELGLSEARKSKLDPLKGSDISWY